MAVQNTIAVYKGEKAELNFGVGPSALTTAPLIAGQTTIPIVTQGFPASGTCYLLPAAPGSTATAITYTGLTPGSLIGCSGVPTVARAGALVTSGSVDITAYAITFTMRRFATDNVALLTKAATIVSGPGSMFRVSLVKADTNRQAGTYQHDAQRTDVGSETVYSIGPLLVVQEVLNP